MSKGFPKETCLTNKTIRIELVFAEFKLNTLSNQRNWRSGVHCDDSSVQTSENECHDLHAMGCHIQ